MRTPKNEVRRKMRRVCRLARLLWAASDDLNRTLEELGCDIEYLSDGGGCSLEELEAGNDVTEPLLDRIFRERDIAPK